MGVPQTGLKLPPGCTVKVYMYSLGCKKRTRVLPKHKNKEHMVTSSGCVCCSVVGVN